MEFHVRCTQGFHRTPPLHPCVTSKTMASCPTHFMPKYVYWYTHALEDQHEASFVDAYYSRRRRSRSLPTQNFSQPRRLVPFRPLKLICSHATTESPRMASRSPTLRASSDPFGPDAEKDAHGLNNPPAEIVGRSGGINHATEKPRSSSRRQSVHENQDPFGDEDSEDGVKYRTLKWWYENIVSLPFPSTSMMLTSHETGNAV